jgi:hypothetical protein
VCQKILKIIKYTKCKKNKKKYLGFEIAPIIKYHRKKKMRFRKNIWAIIEEKF